MAYRKKTARRSSYKPKRKAVRRKPARRAAPQTVRIVIEQAAPSLVTGADVISAREVKPKKATF